MKHLFLPALIGASFLTAPTVSPRVDFWRQASCAFMLDLAPWCAPIATPPPPPRLQPILDPGCCSDTCLGPCQ